MKFIYINYFQYSQLLKLSFNVAPLLFIFLADWSKFDNFNLLWLLLSLQNRNLILIEYVFIIYVTPNDSAINYLIEKLLISSFPFIQYFNNSNLIFQSEYNNSKKFNNELQKYLNKEYITLLEFYNIFKINQYSFISINNLITSLFNTSTNNNLYDYEDEDEDNSKIGYLFVSGDRSSVGKSSLCLSLIASLIELGVKASSISYIKPVTQCEAEQNITRYCRKVGIKERFEIFLIKMF